MASQAQLKDFTKCTNTVGTVSGRGGMRTVQYSILNKIDIVFFHNWILAVEILYKETLAVEILYKNNQAVEILYKETQAVEILYKETLAVEFL